jgi:predicted nucleotidyltransferase
LVEYQDVREGKTAGSYFGLLAELRELFDREIDLVEKAAIPNAYFLRAIVRGRLVVYPA